MAQIHAQVFGHLMKRAADFGSSNPALPKMSMDKDRDDAMNDDQNIMNELLSSVNWTGMIVMGVTLGIFYLAFLLIAYAIPRLCMTLAMIETPTVDYIPISALDNLDADSHKPDDNLLIDGEPHIVERRKPVTNSIRRTFRHLTTIGGKFALWRGLGYGIIYTTTYCFVYGFVSLALFWIPGVGQIFAAIVTSVLTAQLHCAWTHKMIAMPSQKGFTSRIPSRYAWRQLWIPTVVASASIQTSILILTIVGLALGGTAIKGKSNSQEIPAIKDSVPLLLAKGLAWLSLAFFLGFFVVLPNYAALTRIEATLLPDEEDTIVPFDRTFGGKVTPVVVGGSGFPYVKEVCRTFDREARVRIIKLFFKTVGILLVFWTIQGLIMGVEAWHFFREFRG